MEKSVLDQISPIAHLQIYYDEWCNGKKGAICDEEGNGIYRFYEITRDEKGTPVLVHDKTEDHPIVIVGIVAFWLRYRKNTNNLLRLVGGPIKTDKTVLEQFESYTQERYKQFKDKYRDDPRTWKWDWDYEFYAKHIIPHELNLNNQAKALFEYITDADKELVRSVMDNYIEYLTKCRADNGYKSISELKVLRYIDTSNVYKLEGMEEYSFVTSAEKLEKEGFIRVAWIEGHGIEDIKILPKGRELMKQLEEEERGISSRVSKLPDVLNTKRTRKAFARCIEKGWMNETDTGYNWTGLKGCRGTIAQLAYLCGKIYGFRYNGISSNNGKEFPDEELCKLFNVKELYKQLVQVYNADKPQKWRTIIDEIFL